MQLFDNFGEKRNIYFMPSLSKKRSHATERGQKSIWEGPTFQFSLAKARSTTTNSKGFITKPKFWSGHGPWPFWALLATPLK